MKHTSQQGFTSLAALLLVLLSLSGTGMVYAYEQKHPEDFRNKLHQAFGITMRELPKLPSIPTASATVEAENTLGITPTPTSTPTPALSPTPKPSIGKNQEELRENDEAKIHENENEDERHDDGSARGEAKFSIGVY